MRVTRLVLRSLYGGLLHPSRHARYFSTSSFSGGGSNWHRNSNSFESADEFERRMFGGSGSFGDGSNSDPFYRKLDRLERARGGWRPTRGYDSEDEDGDDLDETFDTLDDGMDDKLKDAATAYFPMGEMGVIGDLGDTDDDEIKNENFVVRPEVGELENSPDEYDVKDLDLTRPHVEIRQRHVEEFQVTTEEALTKADFRNVRFLANFITEAGIIKKRSQTGISAKAQRKIAREIKTARAFGLMPFTTMGTKSFTFGRSMQNFDGEYEYRTYGARMAYELDQKDGAAEVEPVEG